MQFNRTATKQVSQFGSQYQYLPLPKPSIDTGMGLERVAAVIQGKLSNFETDLLWPLVGEAADLAGTDYGVKAETDISLRILADHARAATFLISDGVLPFKEDRGYVLRRILRRASLHGKLLGLKEPFIYKITGKVAELMSDAYPELLESTQHVATVVKAEEQRFAHTMENAWPEVEKLVAEVTREIEGQEQTARQLLGKPTDKTIEPRDIVFNLGGERILPGEKLFRLYDTFGVPLDWIKEIVSKRGFKIDESGFEAEMVRQRERARASWKGAGKEVLAPAYAEVLKKGRTVFEGYTQTASHDCTVIGLLREGALVGELPTGAKAELVLDHTPFYAEAGGQVGDTGVLLREGSDEVVAHVEGTYSPVSGLIAHRIVSHAPIRVGDRLTAVVDAEKRDTTRRNHTGTHLLHAALRQVLGTHVKQAGSVVEPGRLRFDFSHFASVAPEELEEIEKLANAEILKNTAVATEVMELDQALDTGAMAFFGEKYPDRVRVVTVPGFSKELCGGTHVSRTGDIGLLKITHEGSISAGVRRVEAVTGAAALEQFQQVTSLVHRMAGTLKTAPAELPAAVERLAETERELEKQLETLKLKAAQAQLSQVEDRIRSVKDVRVLSVRLESLDRGQMRSMADVMRQRLKSGVVVLATASDPSTALGAGGKVSLIAALTPDLTKRLHAGKIAQAVAQRLGGTGGGRPDIAEAGGKNVNILDSVLNEVYEIVAAML